MDLFKDKTFAVAKLGLERLNSTSQLCCNGPKEMLLTTLLRY
jgi:hypothetical protein